MKNKKSEEKKNGNTIHVMLKGDEAVIGKRDLLSSEMNLLKISKNLSKYKELRLKELAKKKLIKKKFTEIKRNLTRLQNLFPGLKIPKILKNEIIAEEDQEKDKESLKLVPPKNRNDVELQLREIQAKLEKLQGY